MPLARLDALEVLRVARAEALGTLAALREAREESEARQASGGATDVLKQATGRSALDIAIAQTERMVESLERHVARAEAN